MGKKIDALLGRTFKTSKFKPAISLAISRIFVLKNQRRARMSVAQSDVIELLKLGQDKRALIRVEQVIKEQNMLDVFVMIEGYCHLLTERLNLVENERGCPEELEEAVSSLIYASTRCGEFPELQELRTMFTSCFGREFTASAVDLRNNCRVNPKVVAKLSTRQPNLESRMKVLKEIASENDIRLQDKDQSSITTEENFNAESKQKQSRFDQPKKSGARLEEISPILLENKDNVGGFPGSMKAKIKYRDVADAAQAAFESAACAADAARAAVELSRSESHDPDDQIPLSFNLKKVSNTPNPRLANHHEEMQMENDNGGSRQEKNARENKRSLPSSSPDSSDIILQGTAFPTNTEVQTTSFIREVVFDESDDEESTEQHASFLNEIQDLEFEMKHGLLANKPSSHNSNTINVDNTSYGINSKPTKFSKKYPLTSQAASERELEQGAANPKINHAQRSKPERSTRLNFENRPMSVRTR
ncbi:putative vacuolar protein sorting-associated protein Ist1 [Heracleum sosnowskyi]|uniref:Vacuolar protein sorting-associated protein Ist1 n=1 Tax=Heracleum sosnowskyi TaxID=360622 RepID=A0AAD8IS97_9APIA|nr:putative vacuolar protein sorting-associated protein Ist1 [Heracleum sosnowskyi]